LKEIADIDAHAAAMLLAPSHFKCKEPRGESLVHKQLEDWRADCSFSSGMAFAMRHSPCISFTFRGAAGPWSSADEEALGAFRANGDSDPLVRCGPASVDEGSRRLTLCDPRPPAYLLDGMRLYAVASLDEKLNPIDRLKLMQIDPSPACP
jgi:hypothetical protein